MVLAGMALSIAAFSPVGSHQCEAVRDNVLRPVRNVTAFLRMDPDLESLSGPGCWYILQQFKRLPSGAELVRQIASQRVEHTSSRCVTPINSVHYLCSDPAPGESPVCAPQTFSYCGQWAYSMTNQEASYEQAMELAFKLDTAYDKAQALCGMAMRWEGGAHGVKDAARSLIEYLGGEIRESSERIEGESCGG